MSKGKMIYSHKNFIKSEKCDEIISNYILNVDISFRYGNTYPLNIKSIDGVTDKIESICKKFDPNIRLDLCQIVKWPSGSKMAPHVDDSLNDRFAALIYLNDNYLGGETVFDELTIFPEKGKLVIFENSKLQHSVSEIVSGVRYTLALWFVGH